MRQPFDLIVVGAGINGVGIARDAALRGLKVLLLEKNDLSSGTTWTSTRLIHGGLRYLEYAEVHLVRESLREREILLRLAPHLVKPLPLLIPIYSDDRRGPALVRAGMLAYDLLSFDKSLEHHRMLGCETTLQRAPGLRAEGLRGAALYYDAQVEYPERLVVENALSAVRAGAQLSTYCQVDEILIRDRRVQGVRCTDRTTGTQSEFQAPVVVNVTGPWVDQLLGGVEDGPLMGGTKGSHIVVAPFPGAPEDALYAEAGEDHRPFFIVPWNDLYLVGTTDIRYEGALDHVRADRAEVEYLLREANRLLPSASLGADAVLYTYSGIRPLPRASGPEAGITRRHVIKHHVPRADGLYSIIGGKLTTYRNLARQTVDRICRRLGRPGQCVTGVAPLPGATNEDLAPRPFAERFELESLTAHHLLRVYGRRAYRLMSMADNDPKLREVICPHTGAIAAEVLLALEEEMAHSLADVLLRRTMIGLGPDQGRKAAPRAAALAARHRGWDQERTRRELDSYFRCLAGLS